MTTPVPPPPPAEQKKPCCGSHSHGHSHRGFPFLASPDDAVAEDALREEVVATGKVSNMCFDAQKKDGADVVVDGSAAPPRSSSQSHSHSHHHHHHHAKKEEATEKEEEEEVGCKVACCGGGHHSDSNHHHHHTHDEHVEDEGEEEALGTNHRGGGGNDDDAPLCLAVIREGGADVVVFDASGEPRTFRYEGDVRDLCFESHGNIDESILTPCFDGDGMHGSPEDNAGCFCGVDAPHLHAHLKDPQTCGTTPNSSNNNSDHLARLATHTLLTVRDDNFPSGGGDESTAVALRGGPDGDKVSAGLLNISVTESMPNQCNAWELEAHRMRGARGKGSHGNGGSRRIHKVKHDDHYDYLVHNKLTGQLHLEHPCDNCGMDDVHGTFKIVGQRRLARSGSSDVQLHFFEVSQQPFSLLEHFQNVFQPHQSDRVAAVENLLTPSSSGLLSSSSPVRRNHRHVSFGGEASEATKAIPKTVRSTFACTGICCSSEIPAIRSILEPVSGVRKVLVNASVKQVLVDFDPSLASTSDLAQRLTKNGFVATVKFDGGGAVTAASGTGPARTVLYVEGICCASEVPAVTSILEPLPGVSRISVNTTAKLVYVHHIAAASAPQLLADALSREGFAASIKETNATKSTGALSSNSPFVRSTLSYSDANPDGDPTIITAPRPDADNDLVAEDLAAVLRAFPPSQVESFVVDAAAKTITVVHSPFVLSAQTVADKLATPTARLQVTVTLDGGDPKTWNLPAFDDVDAAGDLGIDEGHTYPRPTVVLSGVCWIISMLHYVGGKWDYLKYVGLLSVLFGLPTIALKSLRTMRRFQFDANCLMLFASIGALALQEYSEAAALVFLFSISEWLEVRATSRARRALSAIVQLRPDRANIVHPTTHELTVVPASCVPVGALVSVRPGEKVPCDGVVEDGVSTVDESSLTGESRPIRKGLDDAVSGGTVNCGLAPLLVRTTATADNSAVAKLIRLVEEAQANKSATEKLVDEFAKYYTPVIVLAGIFMVSVPWAFGEEAGQMWTNNGLVLIVIACPCALIISTPVSYVAGLAAAAQKGVLIKGGAHLEALGLVQRICFDKTGTLTNGEFALLHLELTSDCMSRIEVLEHLSLMEEQASHPVASAILKAAGNEKVSIPKDKVLSKHVIVEGEGIAGVIDDLEVFVGNERMFARLGLLATLSEQNRGTVNSWKGIGGTVGFMAVEGLGIVCAFCAADGIRPESTQVIQKLKKQGIKTLMLTGDNRDAALAIGQQVGLAADDVLFGLLPEEKLRHVEDFSGTTGRLSVVSNPCSKRQLTMMVGDGVNDAPALAVADVGVAMGAGAALAMETADVTLLDSNLEKLLFAMVMGRRVLNKIKQNILFSLVVKFTVLGFALAGKTNLWAAIGSDVGSMILVTLNSMMLLPARQRSSDVQALKADIEKGNSSHSRGAVGGSAVGTPKSPSSCQKKGCCNSGTTTAIIPSKITAALIVATPPTTKPCSKGCCDGPPKPNACTSNLTSSTKAAASEDSCTSNATPKTTQKSPKPCSHASGQGHSHGHCHGHSHGHGHGNNHGPGQSHSCGHDHSHSHVEARHGAPAEKKSAGHSHSCAHNHTHQHGGAHP